MHDVGAHTKRSIMLQSIFHPHEMKLKIDKSSLK